MSKMKRFSAFLLTVLMLFGICLPNGLITTAYAADEVVMKFTFGGTTYEMKEGSSGGSVASGVTWKCGTDNKFEITFYKSGTFKLISGDTKNAKVTVIGGGAGGTAGYGVWTRAYGKEPEGYGGNGGGGGALVTQAVTVGEGTTHTIVIGEGGAGGVPATGNPTMAFVIEKQIGQAGGKSSFDSIIAAGGEPDKGAAGAYATGVCGGWGTGSNATKARDGGGGGACSKMAEDDCANYSEYGWACWICYTCTTGKESSGWNRYTIYGDDKWTIRMNNKHPIDYAEEEKEACNGGTGLNGGGNGAYPGNEHCNSELIGGTNGIAGSGGGGGGGSYGARVYRTKVNDGGEEFYYDTFSAKGAGFATAGGAGGSGSITFAGEIQSKGQLNLTKTSANTSFTNNNTCYSLNGAVYGVYASEANAKANSNVIAKLTTGADGKSNTIDITKGVYYIKEITAPPGFALDPNVYSVTVESGKTTNLPVKDKPIFDPISILVKKTDAASGSVPSGAASLAGAEFTFKFYPGQYSTVAAAEASGAPLRTWVFKTDDDGYVYPRETSLVSGDELWLAPNGDVTFPLGTLVIQETKAPEHYFIDNTKFIAHITEDGTDLAAAYAYNAPEHPNTLVHGGVSVTKKDSELSSGPQGEATLEGAVFSIYNNNDTPVFVNGKSYAKGKVVATITTGANGRAQSATNLLPLGSYIIKETTAPAGYALNTTWSATFSITDTDNNKRVDVGSMTDEVLKGKLTVQKADAETNLRTPQGDGSFAGATFDIVNASAKTIVFNGQQFAPSAVVTTITTNANGVASASNLPYGKYKVVEKSIPSKTGYTVNSDFGPTVTVSGKGTFSSDDCLETVVIHGGVQIAKVDAGTGAGPQGNATLGNAVFSIINASAQSVYVNGKLYAVGEEVATAKTNASGIASLKAILPIGTYTVKEKTPSAGYLLNTDWSKTIQIRTDGQIVKLEGEDVCPETPITGGLKVQKVDAVTGLTTPEGDAKLSGAKFEVTNASAKSIIYNGNTIASGAVVDTISTNGNGVATIASGLPYGTYTIKEVAASTGYFLNADWVGTVTITEQGKVITLNGANACPETPYVGGMKMAKVDALLNEATAEGDATLQGAVFQIVNASANAISYNGSSIAPGAVVTTITTDANGAAALETGLPYGTYKVKEQTPSKGYLLNSNWVGSITITENGQVVDLSGSSPAPETPIRGGVSVQKIDKDTGTNRGIGGLQMKNAEFTIINRSGKSIIYNGKEIAPFEGEFNRNASYSDGVVCKIYTNADGFATTGAHDLPYGTYEIYETAQPSGYLLNEDWVKKFNITEDGKIITLDNDDACIEELSRTDIHFQKINAITGETIPNVVFKVTHIETGEVHYIVTDPNGVYDSTYIPHSQNTNGNDAAINPDGTVDESKLSYECGTWFGGGTPIDTRPNGKSIGAFVYGNYHFEELRTSANEGLILVEFDKRIYAKDTVMDFGDIEDHVPEELETTFTDADNGNHYVTPGEIVALYDTVVVHNCVIGREYTIEATLMEKDTNAPLCDANGDPITATYKFTAVGTEMTLNKKIFFQFDGALLTGSDLVCFEKLTDGNGHVYAEHEDINDEDQTVKIPKIRTTATDEDGDKYVYAGENAVIIDTIAYESLIPYKTITMRARLVNKATGEFITDAEGNVIEAVSSFKPTKEDGTYDMRIEFDASELKGAELVVYEYAYLASTDSLIALHEDINDEGQTVKILKVGTVASNEEGSEGKAIAAAPDTVIYDRVDYEGLLPDTTYTISGTLCDAETGEEIEVDGKVVTASTTFTTDKTGNGSVYVNFVVDTSEMKNKTLVVFEHLYLGNDTNGKLLADDEELPNEPETVYIPEIATTATTDTGSHTSPANETVTINDEVRYTNLYPGQEYRIEGKLVDKETGEALKDAEGNEITASTTFTPTEPDGSVIITFTLDASELGGKSVVAFETLEYKDLAGEYKFLTDHSDTDDEDQTVRFPELSTNAASVDGLQVINPEGTVTIIDTVHVTNAVIGSEYIIRGTIVDSEGKELKNLEKTEVKVTAEKSDFDVELTFVLDAEEYGLEGNSYTVFEKMFEVQGITDTNPNGTEVEIASHEEVQDENQTVWFPEIKTTATGKEGEKLIEFETFEEEVTIVDTVRYTSLQPGKTYVLTGTLMNKQTSEPIVDDEGKPITATKTFMPSTANGIVKLEFKVLGKYLAGQKVVAFERVTSNGILVAVHEDINDEDQTVEFSSVGKIYKYNGTTDKPVAGAVITVTDNTTGKSFDVTTGEDGYATFVVYAGHSYSYVEKTPPEGFMLNTEKHTFTVGEDGLIIEETKLINLWTGTVVLSKVDVLTNAPVPGATIAVYRKDGNNYVELFRQTTDEYGRIYFYPGDMIGTFYYKEVSAPAGYYLDDDMHSFTIKSDLTVTGQTKFVNAPVGTIVLKKANESGDYLQGAKYGVYDMNGKRLFSDTTDEYGRIYFVSPGDGSYYFVELDSPKGYLKDTTKNYFAIDSAGKVSGTTKLIDKADSSPRTGDQLGSEMWLGAAAASAFVTAAGAVALILLRKKKEEN